MQQVMRPEVLSYRTAMAGTVAAAAGRDAVAAGGATAKLLHLGDIDDTLVTHWDALAQDAAEPNPFAEHWCLLPALQHFDRASAAQLLTVYDSPGQLIGIMPVARASHYGRLPLGHVTNWTHPNAFHGAPLVRQGSERAFWQAVLDAFGRLAWARPLVHFTGLTADGPLHRVLSEVMAVRGASCDVVHREIRALLKSELTPDAYWEAALRGKKRKELRRQMSRLGELGSVEFSSWHADEDVAPWIDDFLALEKAGWKGANGSALACAPDTMDWFRATIAGAASAGRLQIRAMTLDGQRVAMLINFVCGEGGFSFKTAFDESLARFSPGVLLQQDNLDLLNRPGLLWVDSCAAQDHPMIDSLWRERRTIVRISVPLGGWHHRLCFKAVRTAEDIWTRLRKMRDEAGRGTSSPEIDE